MNKKSSMKIMIAALIGMAAAASQAQQIRIVGPMDLSGGAADVGRDALAGVNYAIDKINKQGGVIGRQLTFQYQDSASSPQRAISQAGGLLEGGAALVISPQSSASALAFNKTVTPKSKIPTCVGVSTVDEITMKDINPYVFSVTPTSFMEGKALAGRFAKLPYKRYALLGADYAGGRNFLERFRTALKEANPQAEIVAEEYPKFGATDYTASINKILAAKPDYVFSILFASDLLTFSKQASAIGFFKQIDNKFAALYDTNTLKAMGENAPVGTEGYQRAPASYLSKQSPQAKELIDDFKAKTGGYPSDWALMTYDCVTTWAQAANTAKSIEPAAVMKAIETGTFKSARGTYNFTAWGHQADVPTYFGKVEQSREFGQAILSVQDVLSGAATRPTEAMVRAVHSGS